MFNLTKKITSVLALMVMTVLFFSGAVPALAGIGMQINQTMPAAGDNLFYGNALGSGTGSLLKLQSNTGVDEMVVDRLGNATVYGNITASGGQMRSGSYCDASGGNCFTAATAANGDGYIGEAGSHTAGGGLNMNGNSITGAASAYIENLYDNGGDSYIHINDNVHLHNYDFNYVNQLHFNNNVRFYDEGNDNYLVFRYGDAGAGGIKILDGNDALQGYLYASGDNVNFGLLDADGNWAYRINRDTANQMYVNNSEKFRTDTSGTVTYGRHSVSGDITGANILTSDGVTISGTSGRNYFKDSEKSDGLGLRVGAAWGMYGVYAETGSGVLGGASGVSLQNNSVVVNTSGNVGIGTASPSARLEVRGGTIGIDSYGSTYGVYGTGRTGVHGGGDIYGVVGQASTYGLYGVAVGIGGYGVYGNGDYGGYFVGNGYFSGNVGVGVISPAYKLHVIGDIYANGGWLRTSGNAGWYNESYGGGWYMTDSTWIRSYNNKSIYQNTGTMRTDGTFQVGSGGGTLNVSNGGNFAYRTNVLFANTAGKVGIGTASPLNELHLWDGTQSYGQGTRISFGDSDIVYVGEDVDDELSLKGSTIKLKGYSLYYDGYSSSDQFYETGSFWSTITPNDGTGAPSGDVYYTRIGHMVTLCFDLIYSKQTSYRTSATLSGLPSSLQPFGSSKVMVSGYATPDLAYYGYPSGRDYQMLYLNSGSSNMTISTYSDWWDGGYSTARSYGIDSQCVTYSRNAYLNYHPI